MYLTSGKSALSNRSTLPATLATYFGTRLPSTSKMASILAEMIVSPEMMKRRLREGVEFFRFLRERHDTA